eukprot:9259893-Pyramimonas_sp.AAC.1
MPSSGGGCHFKGCGSKGQIEHPRNTRSHIRTLAESVSPHDSGNSAVVRERTTSIDNLINCCTQRA